MQPIHNAPVAEPSRTTSFSTAGALFQMSSFHSNDYSPSYPAAITSAQTTARYISSPMTSEPDPIVPEFSSPSMIPMVSFLPSPPPLTSDMPPTDPLSSQTPSPSQFNKPPPEKDPPSRSSTTTSIPIHIRRSSQDDDLSTALSVAEYDASRLTIPPD